jgi:hypothetical protein
VSAITDKRRALRAEAAERQKEVVPQLREAVKEARAHKRARLVQIRKRCRARMLSNRERATEARRKLRERLAQTKAKAREACQLARAKATESDLDNLDRALSRLIEERDAIGELRRRARALKDPRGRAGGLRAAELREESDDMVRNDIEDPTLLAVFDRIRHKIKGSKNRTRTEAFFEHIHDHPEEVDEVIAAQQAQWDREATRLMGSLRKVPPASNGDDVARFARELDEADRLLVQHPVTAAEVPF